MENPYIFNNKILNAERTGIHIVYSSHPVLLNNKVENTNENGITLDYTEDAVLTSQPEDRRKFAAYRSGLNNIRVGSGALRTTISDGTIASAAKAGVLVEDGAVDTVIRHITFRNNAQGDVIDHGQGTMIVETR
jgi:parallel beta-helix repeat protein